LGWDLISLTKKSMVEVEPGITLWFTETMTSFSLMPACTAGESGYGSEDTVTPGIKRDVNLTKTRRIAVTSRRKLFSRSIK